jgi:epoxyqueuosine reductase
MSDLANELTDLFIGKSDELIKWGIADLLQFLQYQNHPKYLKHLIPHPRLREFPKAMSIHLAYSPVFETYNESKFHNLLKMVRSQMDDITSRVSVLLKSRGIEHFVIPQGGQEPETQLAMFSHKFAAVHAGLGWIGKSSLLITNAHGPRVYLATILIDSDIPTGEAVLESSCGNCDACVTACPHGFIKGVNWYPGVPREKLIDVHSCNNYREGAIDIIGCKDECGLCLVACPCGKVG